ncbi:MAG: hypothetical protein Q7J85_07100 [Bacillota bacterium]|nr:hypothetical protein [Bacillota bacterium]
MALLSRIKTWVNKEILTHTALNAEFDNITSQVEAGATADQTGAEIKVAYEAEADTNAYNDAAVSKLAGIEALADVTDAVNVGSSIHGVANKAAPVDADKVPLIDTAAASVLKTSTWANIKATLKAYFDTLYNLYSHPNHSGDVTSVTDGAQTIAANAVTNAKAAQMATKTYKGRTTAATGNSEDVAVATVKADLALVKGDVGLGNVENTAHSTDAHIMAIDGRDVSVDGTKLDGIEALADVTDNTNVNAAGATMNADTDVSANGWVVDEDSMASNLATKVPTQQSVKAYVDAVASGLDLKDSSRVATAAALPACTPAGAGVGKTLTADAVGILTVDGVATVLNDRILVKNQVAGADNGIYKVTTEGTAAVAFILTRATDFDTEVTAGAFTYVEEGTVGDNKGYALTTNNPITVDTTALVFSIFSGSAGDVSAAAALTANALIVGDDGAKGVKTLAFGDALALPRVNAAGNAVEFGTGGQIAFPAAAVPSADPNTIDDYEKGTWTPALTPYSGAFDVLTYTTQIGKYTKIGNQVTLSFHIYVNAFTIGTAATAIELTGLPFSFGAATFNYGGGVINQIVAWSTVGPDSLPIGDLASYMWLRYKSATGFTNVPPANIAASCQVSGTILMFIS